MHRFIITLSLLVLAAPLGCAGCVGLGDDDPDFRQNSGGTPPGNFGAGVEDAGEASDGGGAATDLYADGGGDMVDGEDSGRDEGTGMDVAGPADTGRAVCGDGTVEGAEVCDDGNDLDGDYCSADCTLETGSCGDGALQTAEQCDDGVTADCLGTHDGGDGSCVPAGTCAAGYVFSGGGCVANSTGLTVPCQNGSGFTLFRYHYSNNSTSAGIDVWDASCSYSFAPNSACNVYEICPGFCDPDVTSDGYPVFDTSDYMRVRFDVNGLNFSQATLYVQARSYATASSTSFRVWSPLYGETYGGPVDNDFVYDWYAVDWSNFLSPTDEPGLTAVQLYGSNGRVAVKAVELCLE